MDVVNLISDQEQYDEEVIFVAHRISNKRHPLRDTTNNEGDQPNDPKKKEVYFGEVEVQTEKITIKPLEDYPHFRFQCEVKIFSCETKSLHCEMCFCFICDKPVAQCRDWLTHCAATDREKKYIRSRNNTLRKRKYTLGSASSQGSWGLPR